MCTILVTMIEQNKIHQLHATDELYMLLRRKDERWIEATFLGIQLHFPSSEKSAVQSSKATSFYF